MQRGRLSYLVVLLVTLGGCGRELSKNDLGTVVFDVPKVAGADMPYQMPQLGTPKEGDQDRHHRPSR